MNRITDRLIAMWRQAMQDQALCSGAREHIEAVLGAEFDAWRRV